MLTTKQLLRKKMKHINLGQEDLSEEDVPVINNYEEHIIKQAEEIKYISGRKYTRDRIARRE